MNKKRNITVFVSLIVILGLFVVAGQALLSKPAMLIQGEVEARQIKVASKVPGRIAQMLVKEGDKVSQGQQLLVLESMVLDAKLMQAQAAKSAAKAQSKKASNGARKEQIVAAYNMWQKAKAGADYAQKTYDRVQRLFKDGVIPAQKRDETEAKYKAAQVTEKAAMAQYDLAKAGARTEDKEAAMAMVARADGAIAEVEAYKQETKLQAPISGQISDIIADQGELISTGFPIITIVDLADVWVSFHLREDLLAKMRQGDEFDAQFPALGNKIVRLKVSHIKALGSYATWRATQTMGGFDMKTFELQARPVKPVEDLRPGMTAVVNWDEYSKK